MTAATLPDRLLAEAENWRIVAPNRAALLDEAAAALSGRVPEGDMARALEWVQECASEDKNASRYLPAIEEAIAAYDPKAGGRTALSGREAVVPMVETALYGLPHNAPMQHPERDNAELAYTLKAFDLSGHPVGSEQWCHYWRGWWHRSHMDGSATTPQPGGGVVVPAELLRQLRHYTECHRMIFPDCGAPTEQEVAAMLPAAPSAKGVA